MVMGLVSSPSVRSTWLRENTGRICFDKEEEEVSVRVSEGDNDAGRRMEAAIEVVTGDQMQSASGTEIVLVIAMGKINTGK